jgi:hypothetical protein
MNRGKCIKLKFGGCIRVGDTLIISRSQRAEIYVYGRDKIEHLDPVNSNATKEELNERIRMDADNLRGDGETRSES